MIKIWGSLCCRSVGLRLSRLNTTNRGLAGDTSEKFKRVAMGVNENSDNAKDRLIWVDCEMTGLNIQKDKIMEIAVIITEGETLQEVARSDNIVVHVEQELLDSMDEWCTKHHGDSGLTKACSNSKISMEDAEASVLQVLEKFTPRGKCPLAGNSVSEDRKFLEKCMPRVAGHLHYRTVDVSTIKELGRRWNPTVQNSAPKKKNSHRAMDDIVESINELQYYKKNLFKL